MYLLKNNKIRLRNLLVDAMTIFFLFIPVMGCVSGDIQGEPEVSVIQTALVQKGVQKRDGTAGLDSLRPSANPRIPVLDVTKGPDGQTVIPLTLDQALSRALTNSPEITVVSFDPTIAKEKVVFEASKFDVASFGKVEWNDQDLPSNNLTETGVSRSNAWSVGIKQKIITGAEWRLSYGMTRTVDDSLNRIFSLSYEPSLILSLKQPLMRDAWPDVTLSGVKTAQLQYQTALADFRRQVEDLLAQVIALYWTLLQSRRDTEIHRDLLDRAVETLTKVEDRKGIDATMGDIMQAEATVKSREASLQQAKKYHADVQDSLVRLLSDSQINLLSDHDIVPTTAPDSAPKELIQSELLGLALKNNSEIARARVELEIADVNLKVAKRQKLPLVDLIASARLDGLSDDQSKASRMITNTEHESYFLGFSFEYPLGNREKIAEFRQRQLEYSKASSKLQVMMDQIALIIRDRIRAAETSWNSIGIYKDAVKAAKIHLQVIEDIGVVRKKLTPEFLLTIIQAQESLAEAQRGEIKAIADYNIALSRLSQATGTLLNMDPIKQGTEKIIAADQ